LIFLSVTM
jgi:hypothetical protein